MSKISGTFFIFILCIISLQHRVCYSEELRGWNVGNTDFVDDSTGQYGRVEYYYDLVWRLKIYIPSTKPSTPSTKQHDIVLVYAGFDEWSTYFDIHESSKGGPIDRVTIDVFTKRTVVSFNGRLQKFSNKRTEVSILYGRNIGSVDFGCNELRQIGRQEWEMKSPKESVTKRLRGNARDMWSVYLLSEDGKYHLQVDYWLKKVIINHDGNSLELPINGADFNTIDYVKYD